LCSELFHIFSHWFKLTTVLSFVIKSKHNMVLLDHITYSELPIYSRAKLIFFTTQPIRKNWLKLHNIVRNLNIFLSKSMYSILEAIVVKCLPHPLIFWRSHNRILAQRLAILTGFQSFPHTFPRKCHNNTSNKEISTYFHILLNSSNRLIFQFIVILLTESTFQ